MYMTRKRKLLLLMGAVIIFLLLIPVFPIRFVRGSAEDAKEEEYYLVHHISAYTTDGPLWICYGDETGEWENAISPVMTGNAPTSWLSSAVYDGEHFLIYGSLDEEVQTLQCEDWDIVGEIHRAGETLRLDLPHYVTLLDCKWFDPILNYNTPR